jgi:hypothetical protein
MSAKFFNQSSGGSGGGGGLPFALSQPPLLAGFTQKLVTAGATVVQLADGSITLFDPGIANDGGSDYGNINGIYKAAPAAPFRLSALILPTIGSSPAESNAGVGIGWYDGIATAQAIFLGGSGGSNDGASTPALRVMHNALPNSHFDIQDYYGNAPIWSLPLFLAIHDDGVNANFQHSGDGVNWFTDFSVAKAAGPLAVGGGYVNIGFFVSSGSGAGVPAFGTLVSWNPGA